MKTLQKIYAGLIFVFLYAPILIMIAFSFNNSKSRSVWAGFTFKWYKELFHNDVIMNSLWITLRVALLSAIIATFIGTIAAIGIYKMKKFPKRIALGITNIPMVNPEIVTGVSLMLLFALLGKKFNFELGFGTLLISHITFNLPYVILSVMPKLRQTNKHLVEAAVDLGCRPWIAFYKVLLPEIMPGVLTGFIMALTLSIDDFVISYFTSGATAQTLSVTIYSMTKRRISPEINALSTILFLSVLILLVLTNLSRSKNKNKGSDKVKKGDR